MSIFNNLLSMMDIYFSVDNNAQILKLPYVPPEVVINSPLEFESFENSNGKILTLTGEPGLRSLSIESFFPSKFYKWIPSLTLSPFCLDFFNSNRKKVFRIVILSATINLNMQCIISNFTYKKQQNGNIKYTLEIQEYINPGG